MLTSVPRVQKSVSDLPSQKPDPTKIAVLLNRNARRVNDKLARKVGRLVGKENLFYSRSLEEAESFCREIVQRGYGTVICGGGDGTLCQTVNLVHHYLEEANAWREERYRRFGERQPLLAMPRFALLKLGTGNGLRQIVGAGNPLKDLRRLVDFAPARTQQVPLIESDGQRFFFGGMGYDSMLLNDYNWLKTRTTNRLFKPVMHSVLGYFAALFSRTLPSLLFNRQLKLEARVTTLAPAFYVDPRRGDRVEEIPAGTTLFEGSAQMIAAGTTPYYGYGFRVFPFAGIMPGMMNLRIAQIGPLRTLANLSSIWRGHYRNHKLVHDFLVSSIRIELEQPFPFQHSGDAQGLRETVDLKIGEPGLELVDYYQARRIS